MAKSPQLKPGDFIIHREYCALVVLVEDAEIVIVPVVSARFGRHRSDVMLDANYPRTPATRPVLRCKSVSRTKAAGKKLTGASAPQLVAPVLAAIRREQSQNRFEAGALSA